MQQVVEMRQFDLDFYRKNIKDFLPERIIDIHTHVWRGDLRIPGARKTERAAKWPSLIAKENTIQDLQETYRLMFPDKKIKSLIFGEVSEEYDIVKMNEYVSECTNKYGYPSLYLSRPELSPEEFERDIEKGGFLGCKVYLNYAPIYLPEKEIRIFDFLPKHHLDVLNRRGWITMLHIPRPLRLRDPVNLAQMIEIEKKYPRVKLIIAHVGRAYCDEDVGNAFNVISNTDRMMFDISANSNQRVFELLIKAIGSKRILFGSDLPILRMRARRVCENGKYINLVPKGLYGDVSSDSHMREIEGTESESLTFLLYEEINAFRRAAEKVGLTKEQCEDVFYNNAAKLLDEYGHI